MRTRTLGRPASRLAAFAASAVLALSGGAALAQPSGGPGHGPGHGGGGMDIGHVLGAVKGQLNLDTSQQLQWDNAVAQSQAARVAGRSNMQKLHDALATELAKPEPDLAAVAAVADGAQTSNQTLRQGVRAQWLQLYATFSPAQKAVVRDALAQQLARKESMAARMKAHMQPGG